MLKILVLSYSELILITAHCSWIVKIYIYFYSHQLSLLSPDGYGLAMVRWSDNGFFSLTDGPMVTMWFLGHVEVFFYFFWLFFVVAVDLVGGWWRWWWVDVVVLVWVGGCGGSSSAENSWVEKERDKGERERERERKNKKWIKVIKKEYSNKVLKK